MMRPIFRFALLMTVAVTVWTYVLTKGGKGIEPVGLVLENIFALIATLAVIGVFRLVDHLRRQ